MGPLLLRLLAIFTSTLILSSAHIQASSILEPELEKRLDDHCRRTNVTCYAMQNPICLGAQLPYTSSSLELGDSRLTPHQIKRLPPKCMASFQPLFCAVNFPKCQNGILQLPSQELCHIARRDCQIVKEAMKGDWPKLLQCDDPAIFRANCSNTEILELPFPASGECVPPMIPVENNSSYVDGSEGCGLKCNDPYYTDQEHAFLSIFILCTSLLCLLTTGLAIITVILNWKSAKGSTLTIFAANFFYFLTTLGWMIQFLPNAKQDIVCRKDGTPRRDEHDSGENIFCVLNFVLIYFGGMTALGRIVVFSHEILGQTQGRERNDKNRWSVYFRYIFMFFSIILTFICIFLGKVEGNSMNGICLVGYTDSTIRIWLVLIPISIQLLLIALFFGTGFYRLVTLHPISTNTSKDHREHLDSLVKKSFLFAMIASIGIFTFTGLEIHDMLQRPVFQKSQREALIRNLNLTGVEVENEMPEKHGMIILCLYIGMIFGGGVVVSSFAWTASVRRLKRVLARCTGLGSAQPNNRACAHEDPFGLNCVFDHNAACQEARDVESNTYLEQNGIHTEGQGDEMSSELAADKPHLWTRRGALIPDSNSVSCVSQDNSRRPSCDSAMSEYGSRQFRHSNSDLDRRLTGRERLRNMSRRLGYPRRSSRTGGSSSSLESNRSTSTRMLNALLNLIAKRRGGHGQGPGHGGMELRSRNNQRMEPAPVREFAIQTGTSIEKLSDLPPFRNNFWNTTNMTTRDQSTQWSTHNLNEIGTQTKKSSTKKDKYSHSRTHDKARKEHKTNGTNTNTNDGHAEDDPVLKLLTPSQ